MEVKMNDSTIAEQIQGLKKARNAVIVAHNYQNDEVQEIADAVGDSFYLSKLCATNPAQCIVFCGVGFMAESAKILSPQKTVLLPERQAGCPMADSVTVEDVRALKAQHPGAAVMCYINTSAEVKAECDVCCTSSNAVKIARALPQRDIIFVPDRNLGHFVAMQLPEKNFFVHDGCCVTHTRIGLRELEAARKKYPGAPVAVHPECPPELVDVADFTGSTSEIIDFCRRSPAQCILIGTEMGILHTLRKDNPQKEFILLSPRLVCSNMKMTTLESVRRSLDEGRYVVEVEESIRLRAKTCLERMLAIAG
ncbi:MAG: quinolinate synthase NadA [Clostridia bacterium]|nr:quinolinate synthase NadA [Clostridia bacterium]